MADEIRDISPAGALAKAHADAHAGEARASLLVPEWGADQGRPLVLYWRPFTLADHARCFGSGEKADARALGQVVYHKAEDREGRRAFAELNDLHVLTYVADQMVVRRIATAIMRAPSISEMVKKLEGDAVRMAAFRLADMLGQTIDQVEQLSLAKFHETLAFYELKKKQEDQAQP
jgi:hypothetical protein